MAIALATLYHGRARGAWQIPRERGYAYRRAVTLHSWLLSFAAQGYAVSPRDASAFPRAAMYASNFRFLLVRAAL